MGGGGRLTPEVVVSKFYVMTSLIVSLTKDTILYIIYKFPLYHLDVHIIVVI